MVCTLEHVRDIRLPSNAPRFIEGFTAQVPYYMRLSDFLIGKPGPGSMSEALAKKLPVIVRRNGWTMAHERYNTEWIQKLGAGIVVKDFSRELPGAVRELLVPANYARYRDCAAATRNRAVFEIPEMLSNILEVNGWSQPGRVSDCCARSR